MGGTKPPSRDTILPVPATDKSRATSKRRRPFGSTRALPSGRVQARYRCPECQAMHPAHTTFDTHGDADTWLATVRTDIVRERYVCPVQRKVAEEAERLARQRFRDYAEHWLTTRRKRDNQPLTERTRRLYRKQLDELLETFGDLPLEEITTTRVRNWWRTELPVAHPDRPTGNAHVYALLRTILGSAVEDELLPANPASVRGAGRTSRQRRIEPATVPELQAIADGMPPEYAMAVLLAGWCALRFGEVVELRRRDIAKDASRVSITRAASYRDGVWWVGPPKAESVRDVAVPPHLRDPLLAHLETYGQPGPDGLLFPAPARVRYTGRARGGPCECGYAGCTGGHMMSSEMYARYMPARETAGRPDLRWHDLRHTGLTFAAHAGASLGDLMARAGHKSMDAARIYQHAAQGRDDEIAARMSELLGTTAN